MAENFHMINGDYDELKAIGITRLTGEADGTDMGRTLCDLTPEGAALVAEYLGGCEPIARNWNPGAERSFMATDALLKEILFFHWIRNGWIVYEGETTAGYLAFAYKVSDEKIEELIGHYTNGRRYRADGTAGTRNLHVFTGRIT